MEVGSRSLVLRLTSVIPATFSAQLCVPDGLRCAPRGGVHSATAVRTPVYFPTCIVCVFPLSKRMTPLVLPAGGRILGQQRHRAPRPSRYTTLRAGRRQSSNNAHLLGFFFSPPALLSSHLFICRRGAPILPCVGGELCAWIVSAVGPKHGAVNTKHICWFVCGGAVSQTPTKQIRKTTFSRLHRRTSSIRSLLCGAVGAGGCRMPAGILHLSSSEERTSK